MKVLNLRCTRAHVFEGWFGSEAAFQSQHEHGQIECPLCGDKAITKLPSAPRLNVSGAGPLQAAEAASASASATLPVTTAPAWVQALQHVIANTVDVGERFAEEARRMHYGEVDERGIRGTAAPEDVEALREEGIEVAALPIPAALKGPVQ